MSLWSDGACCQTLSASGALAAIRRSAGAVDESWGCVADGSARRSFSRPRARLGLGDALNGGVHSLSTEIELIEDERVGGLHVDVPWLECRIRDVTNVSGDQHLGPCLDGGRQHVMVIRVSSNRNKRNGTGC